jgi:2-(1,2-epoxy-1,2-dihydrophenyl)acetyl-CoA isomerase
MMGPSQSSTAPGIVVDRRDSVVRVTLNRPERRNALSPADFNELEKTFGAIAATPSDRAVVIAGAGTAFCAGADLSTGAPEDPPVTIMRSINEAARTLYRLPQACIASVNGPAFGAGMSLALACDLIVASTDAVFCQVFVKRGLSPDLGSSWLLPRMVGLHVAKRLALLGDAISAEEAHALGIVAEVVTPDELTGATDRWARRLAEGPPVAMALTKQLLNQSWGRSFEEALDIEAAANAVNASTQDTVEALTAFVEKRQPRFHGR